MRLVGDGVEHRHAFSALGPRNAPPTRYYVAVQGGVSPAGISHPRQDSWTFQMGGPAAASTTRRGGHNQREEGRDTTSAAAS